MSQNSLILQYLKRGKKLTAMTALDRFECFRLASRIHDLRNQGHDIHVETVDLANGKHIARYWL